jgi:molecular chaperone GrpE
VSTPSPDPDGPRQGARERYLALFASWLDRALAEESAPAGLDERIRERLEADRHPPGADLGSLFGALAALTQEVRLQGRAFKGLAEALSPLGERLEALTGAAEAEPVEPDEDRAFLDCVGLLLDLRDRLARGLATAEPLLAAAPRPVRAGLVARLFGRGRVEAPLLDAVGALLAGYRLTLDHLDDALRDRGVSLIPCEGRPFDPHAMSAVDLLLTGDEPEGTVVEVYRTGWEWNGRVLRPAQVKVARRPESESET